MRIVAFHTIVLIFLLSKAYHGEAVSFDSLKDEKLENGLELVTLESKKVPLVTIVLAVRAGAMTETPETDGLTHLWEHMFFKGNARLKNQEAFKKRVRQLGIVYNGDTSAEKVRYYFTLPSAYLEEGLQFMSDAIATPKLDRIELEKERKVVLDEYDRNASSPSFDTWRIKSRILYGDKHYLRSALGTRDIIAKTTRKQLLQIKKDVFVPSNSALFVAGDIDPKKVKKLVQKHFKNWKDSKSWRKPKPNQFQPFPKLKNNTFVTSHKRAKQANLAVTFEGPKARVSPKDTYAADILISLLKQRTGKFYQKYIDSQLTYSAGLSYHTQSQAATLVLHASSSSENAKKVLKSLDTEPENWLKDDYFTKEQIDDVRRQLSIAFKMEANAPSEYVKTLAFWWAVTDLEYYRNYLDNLQKTSIKDVQGFIKKYMIKKPAIKTAFLPTNELKKAGLKDQTKKLKKTYLIN